MPGENKKRKRPPPRTGSTGWQADLLRRLQGAGRIALLGIGQPLKGDDAAGGFVARSVARRLGRAKPESIMAIAADDAPESLTSRIRRFAPTHVLIVDAGSAGRVPGTVFIADPRRMEPEDITTHRLPISLLMRYLEESIPCTVVVLAIEPATFSSGSRLSPEVKRSAAEVSRFLALRLPEAIGSSG